MALEKSYQEKLDDLQSELAINESKLKSSEKLRAASEDKCEKMMHEIAALETYQMQVCSFT